MNTPCASNHCLSRRLYDARLINPVLLYFRIHHCTTTALRLGRRHSRFLTHSQTHTHSHTNTHTYTNTHTHTFNGPFSGTTQVSRYQKGKTYLDFTEARDSEWKWHQLGHMQVCTSPQTDNHASTSPLSFLQAGCPSCCPTNSVKALKAALVVLFTSSPYHGLQQSLQPSRYYLQQHLASHR